MIPLIALVAFQAQVHFARLFPRPTGVNGYEEYVRAADLLASKGNFNGYEMAIGRAVTGQRDEDNPEAPKLDYLSAQTQEVNAYSEVGALIASGNLKRVYPPQRKVEADTTLPEFAGFKSVAKYQAHAAYVAFADGRSKDGLQYIFDTMTFGRNISQALIIGRLVGIACQSIVIRELDRHLGQLSLDEVKTVEQFADAETSSPCAAIECLQNETSHSEKILYNSSSVMADALGDDKMAKVWSSMNKEQQDSAVDSVDSHIRSAYQNTCDLLTGPESGWLSGSPKPPEEQKPATSVQEAIYSSMGIDDILHSVVRVEAIKRTQFRLMHLHARVLEYRWLHGRLPTSLYECASNDDIRDKVCGGAFAYRVDGQTYTLKSQGSSEIGEITLGMYRTPASSSAAGGSTP